MLIACCALGRSRQTHQARFLLQIHRRFEGSGSSPIRLHRLFRLSPVLSLWVCSFVPLSCTHNPIHLNPRHTPCRIAQHQGLGWLMRRVCYTCSIGCGGKLLLSFGLYSLPRLYFPISLNLPSVLFPCLIRSFPM